MKKINIMLVVMLIAAGNITVSYSQERLIVRSGDHPTYSRMVFDWEKNVTYTAERIGQNIEINFNANAIPDFTSVLLDGPTYFSNPQYEIDNGNLKVIVRANSNGVLRHFKSGTKIVVDLMSANAAVDSVNTRNTIIEPITPTVNAQIGATDNDTSIAMDEVRPEIVQNADLNSDDNLTVIANATNNAFIINYPWADDVKAAAFIRSNMLWVIFNKHTNVDHNHMNNKFGERIFSANQLNNAGATILTYAVAPGQNARMEKNLDGWQLSLRSNIAVPLVPIDIGRQSLGNAGENIFLAAQNLGNIIHVVDPYIGDDLTIVTASLSSQGVVEQNNFTEFNIIKTAQGIALHLIADDIFVTRHNMGIAISGQNGLAVSRSRFPILREELPVVFDEDPNADTAIAQNEEPRMLIDFDQWQVGPIPHEGYVKNRHELLYLLSTTTDDGRNEARWNLATYNIANNNAAEAYGILQLMAENEPGFLENPSYRAALAVSNIKLRRFNEAIELLKHKSLVVELDALLWRALAYEEIGEYQKAMDDFSLGVDVLSLQQNENKAEFLFSSIRSSSNLNDIEYMNRQINGMATARLNARQLTELDYWRARMAEKYGDDALAAQEYEKVISAGVRRTAAHSKFARIKQQYRLKEIEVSDAIDELEKLRFSWRGDNFELELLEQLGEFYVDMNDYREGLSTLRQAATYFPKSNKTSALTKKMTDIYYDLYLNGQADNLPPLKAMALFLEFRELTPLGADGDVMSRNLAARMVSVDLLNDAATILEHQVFNRLQGVARADIASNLAMIYLMNKEPQKALNILRTTRQSQIPDDIEFERKMIEIRTLVELDSYEEAEVMLEGIDGEVAEKLRSDIFWKTEDWPRVVNHGYQTLGDRWTDSEELDAIERQTILRIAVALSLDENITGLDDLRSQYLNHMEDGTFANAFEVITAKEQKTGKDIRLLTQTIASVDRLTTFMDSYRNEFDVAPSLN